MKIRNEFGNDPMKMCSEHAIKMKVCQIKKLSFTLLVVIDLLQGK